MRIAELSRRSATSIPSIKYYLREGLIPGGRTTGRNQADYDEAHVRRLRLIRALVDVGGLSIAAVRDVLAAVDNPDLPGHDLLGIAHHAVSPHLPDATPTTRGGRPRGRRSSPSSANEAGWSARARRRSTWPPTPLPRCALSTRRTCSAPYRPMSKRSNGWPPGRWRPCSPAANPPGWSRVSSPARSWARS
ncbi:MerR family transcriptional regulator [Luedemannella flava]